MTAAEQQQNHIVKSLVQCNKCNAAGHPNQMIGFIKTDKKKSDGKPFWDLVNSDMSPHVHKTTIVLPDIEAVESNKPLPKTSQSDEIVTDSLSFTSNEIMILKELAAAISIIKVKH